MEANRWEVTDFFATVDDRDGCPEKWHIYKTWITSDGTIAWYEGEKLRGEVLFRRIFSPDEIKHPEVKYGIA